MITLKNILVATDFGGPSESALLYGQHLARTFGADLHVLHVVDDLMTHVTPMTAAPMDLGPLQAELEADGLEMLKRAVPRESGERPAHLLAVASYSPAVAILSYAKDADIDLIVIGTHGRGGMAHFVMGSVAEKVVRTAPCPVLTLRQHERHFVKPDAVQAVTHS